MRLTFLGTGTSHGVPSIDCMISDHTRCPKGVCRASISDPRHCRGRCSALIEYNQKRILIDVSLDFRAQMLRERAPALDAVLITHPHADHIGGIADIRSYTREKPLPFYGSAESVARIRECFPYIFNRPALEGGGIPDMDMHEIGDSFDLFGLTITPIPVEHGSLEQCLGYRVGALAYIPDCKRLGSGAQKLLAGIDTLVLDALRDTRPHSTHMILPESMALARELSPRKCYFTHLCHDIHYQQDATMLDEWMAFAYDGLKITIGE